MTDFSQQTAEYAESYRNYVESKIEVDLTDAVHYVRSRGESIEVLDGTVESLDALSAMVKAWVSEGLTGIPLGLPLSPDGPVTDEGDDEMALWSRVRFLVPWIFAYVLEIVRQRDPGARLSVYTKTRGRRVVDINLNTTGIALSDGTWFPPHFIMSVLYGYARGTDLDETRLRLLLLDLAPGLLSMSRLEERGPFDDYLQRPPVPASDRRRFPPIITPPDEAEAAVSVRTSAAPFLGDDEYLIARGRADGLDEPSAFRPLPLADVTTWLASLGAPTAGLAEALAAASDDFETSMGELVGLQLALAKGSVRAIFIERAGATDDEWIGFCMGAKKFAKSVRARFGTEDEWPE